ncbi:MAG: L-type lectin-domain containing protein [Saprospiraceae bacterium]
MTRLILIAVFALVATLHLPLFAQDLITDDFTMSGDTYLVDDQCFRLTDESNYSSGSIWYKYPINLTERFDIELEIMMGCKNDDGADGMVFIFTNRPNRVGGSGEGIGFGGLRPSFGIEIDTWRNYHLYDPAEDHVAVLFNGHVAHYSDAAPPTIVPNLEDCTRHRFAVRWEPDSKTLAIEIDRRRILRARYDLVGGIFGGNPTVYWGVSAGTGRYNNIHEVCFDKMSFSPPAKLKLPEYYPGVLDRSWGRRE